jgi:hypothetical protein
MRLCAFTIFAIACVGTVPGDDWQPVSYVDEGELCFQQDDTEVVVEVDPGECLSSSCSRSYEGSCTATVQDDTITVTSDISWEQNEGESVPCTDDCGFTAVTCTLPALADGTYTVVFGDEQSQLVVPIEGSCTE